MLSHTGFPEPAVQTFPGNDGNLSIMVFSLISATRLLYSGPIDQSSHRFVNTRPFIPRSTTNIASSPRLTRESLTSAFSDAVATARRGDWEYQTRPAEVDLYDASVPSVRSTWVERQPSDQRT